jgi:preprotein translocase subunit SecD
VGTVPEAAPEATLADGVDTDALLDFFQVRLMAEPQDRELIPVTHFAAPGAQAGVLVAVQNDVILDSRAVTGAEIEHESERIFLRLRLTDEGQNALADACFSHLGKQLAIVYEDELLCAPTIVDWEQAELRFRGMNADWPQVAEAMAERLGRI